jgi:hypothetical protein
LKKSIRTSKINSVLLLTYINMGFFGKLFSAGPAMNRLAKACDETLNCLRRFDFTGDKDELYKAAWIFTYGVQMSLEKWNWNPFTTKVFIPNHPEFGRIALNQVVILILGSIARESKIIGEEGTIKSILDGDDGFNKYEYLVSQNMKSKIQP